MGWPGRVWDTLHEPRVVTALMIITYLCLVVMGGTILASPRVTPPDVVLGCVVLIGGGVLGVPAAWTGAAWLEGPALGLSAVGLGTIAVVDMIRVISTDHWIGYPTLLTVAMCLMLCVRMARVWPMRWTPGHEPDTPLRRSQRRAAVEVVLTDDAITRAIEREEAAE
ncbi:MAG: hypothetical protein Q4C85_08690 [Actinomyces sp.]|uniref:hypothetical protein n=1 Tax=Actinomyces sp. TaxID=29317 RepID=UPI0026DC8076|nr:hypothetical protein [Actinomyces sp.]MDO4243815.1 hypothetical protein [Actinomyces sp.]